MAMAYIWVIMVAVAVVMGLLTGRIDQVTTAALDGAKAAVELCLSLAGVMCLWTGVMEVMRRSGLSGKLARLLRPALSRLFPHSGKDGEAMEALSANVSANLLGLGNAATPYGIQAAKRLALQGPGGGVAGDDLCMLVVLNTASIQLIPATVAGLRASAGAASPFDILPAVWVTSVLSVAAGVTAAKLLSKLRPVLPGGIAWQGGEERRAGLPQRSGVMLSARTERKP